MYHEEEEEKKINLITRNEKKGKKILNICIHSYT